MIGKQLKSYTMTFLVFFDPLWTVDPGLETSSGPFTLVIAIGNALLSAYLLRSYARFREPLISFVLGFFICTFPADFAVFVGWHSLRTFPIDALVLLFTVVWLFFDFCPADIVFRFFRHLWWFLAVSAGLLAALDVVRGLDLALKPDSPGSILNFALGLLSASGKYLLLWFCSFIYGRNAKHLLLLVLYVLIGGVAYRHFISLERTEASYAEFKPAVRLCILGLLIAVFLIHSIVVHRA
jgi:hypothetical protein